MEVKTAPSAAPTIPASIAETGCTQPYTFTEVCSIIKRLYNEKRSLRKIAKEDYQGRISHAVIHRVLAGHEPREPHNRAALGLAAYHQVVVVTGGEVPAGAQVISAKQCACGQWYIPNHPARRRCFLCRPYRGKGDRGSSSSALARR